MTDLGELTFDFVPFDFGPLRLCSSLETKQTWADYIWEKNMCKIAKDEKTSFFNQRPLALPQDAHLTRWVETWVAWKLGIKTIRASQGVEEIVLNFKIFYRPFYHFSYIKCILKSFLEWYKQVLLVPQSRYSTQRMCKQMQNGFSQPGPDIIVFEIICKRESKQLLSVSKLEPLAISLRELMFTGSCFSL